MAIHGSLKFRDRTYNVVECEYQFFQSVDETGKPTSRPTGGIITVVMPSTNDDDMFFYNWMFNKSEVKEGVLRFNLYSQDNRVSYKTVAFANAYCVELRDYFNDHDENLMYTTIKISAQVIVVGSTNTAVFSNAWTNDSVESLAGDLSQRVKDTFQSLNSF
ncbi:MAG: hypothetical protein J1D77_00865 [Muribaculaceae bacterium]|nr:hypothetical protein [Muribaculaceae bacterium]